ncbi:MAG: vWA domain-containing protein [Patescibacteria group bacterium]
MSTFRPWAAWRRLYYGTGLASVLTVIGVVVYFTNFYTAPTCLDGQQNGNEAGIDCGGDCVQVCAAEVIPPVEVWTQHFPITDGQYNVVGYVENDNQTVGTPELHYTIELLSNGTVVAEVSDTTILPPNSVYPIFAGPVYTDRKQPVTDTRLILEPPELWLPASAGRGQFRTRDIALQNADVDPELSVRFENTSLDPATDVEVVATIFNDQGEPLTASQTYIEEIRGRSTEDLVFTWPNPIAKTVRSCIIPTDVALGIDLSGSMNNDSADPPQPLTDTLTAASSFITNLRSNDQVAVVTFATRAAVTTPLTNFHISVADAVRDLGIDPTEETGFTNTVEALEQAQTELNSERHNPDARRVLVVLTDGLPTAADDADPAAQAAATAAALQADGIEIYAIGLGEAVDRAFIEQLASDSSNAFFAPESSDLDAIYQEITTALCESGPTKIDVIAKSSANFAEIRP